MKEIGLKPTADRVIIRPIIQKVSEGGIIITSNNKEPLQEGLVVAVGPGRNDENGNLIPMCVEVGQRVLYPKLAGSKVKYQGEEYDVVVHDHPIVIIEDME